MAYTPPLLPYYGPVAHFTKGSNLPINRVVIHCTAGGSDGSGAQGTARYFQRDDSGGSAQYVVDSDESIQCAYDNVICWHAPPNPHSIGIEIVCSLTSKGAGHWTLPSHVAAMHRAAKLTAQKCLQHDVPVVRLSPADLRAGRRGVTGHVDVSTAWGQSSHWDPGPYFPWDQFMAMVRAEYDALTGTGDLDMAIGDDILRELRALQADFNRFEISYTGRWTQEVNEARAQAQALADKLDAVATAEAADDAGDDALAGARWAQAVEESRAQTAALLARLDALKPPEPPAPLA